jgi:HTH-type transcriptional regulator / antitoxin HigA
MIAVAEKYALEVNSPTPITPGRQLEEYLSMLDKLPSKDHPTSEEGKYAEVLMTLIEAYEEEHHSIPDASPVEVLRTLMDANNLRQKDLVPIFGSESIVSEVLHGKRGLTWLLGARLKEPAARAKVRVTGRIRKMGEKGSPAPVVASRIL